ncbi:MAG: Ig-like domain-containing protein [bacterium]
MNSSFLRKVGILSLVLVVSLSGCKFPWDKDKDDSGGGGTPADNAPSVSITNPADGATVSGTVSVTVSASDDNGISRVQFYIDGVIKSTDTSSPYSYSWDTTAESEGSHTVKVTAYDTANQTASVQHTVTVDNDPEPSVSITSPADGATVSGTVSVTASASDDNGISKVEFYIDDTLKATDTSSPYSYSWDTTAESESSHIAKVTAYDTANQTASSQYTVTVDNIPIASGEWEIIDNDLVRVGTGWGNNYLMWPRSGSGAGCNETINLAWSSAMSWAENLVWKGYDDWRLPTKDELKYLYDYGRTYISYSTHGYWSSSATPPPNYNDCRYAVDFYDGDVMGYDPTCRAYARAVRNGP